MRIDVLLFAAAKEAAGSEKVSIEIPDQPRAADVLEALATQFPLLSDIVPSSRLAVDCCYVGPEASIGDESEVALIPPVSGG